MKKQPTVINGNWAMTWVDNERIWARGMTKLERIRYFPRILLRKWTESNRQEGGGR